MPLDLWPYADPRLMTPQDLISEHRECHRIYDAWNHKGIVLDDGELSFVIFRHEVLRVSANMRSGMKHSDQDTLSQRAHPSPIAPDWMQAMYLTRPYLRALMVYERWVYIRRQKDVETIDLLWLALMRKLPRPPMTVYPTPWAARGIARPGRYLYLNPQRELEGATP